MQSSQRVVRHLLAVTVPHKGGGKMRVGGGLGAPAVMVMVSFIK